MRKLVVAEYVSLDGVVQGPGHASEDREGGFEAGGWTQPLMPDHRRYNTDLYQTAGAFLLGRLTYEIWAAYWPNVTDKGDLIAHALNTQPKYVASTRLDKAEWTGTTIIRDVPAEVPKLKAQSGKPILVPGSSGLAQTLMADQLVDEYQLWLHPVVVGSGKRLFREGGPSGVMRLIDSRCSPGGLVILTYEPQAA